MKKHIKLNINSLFIIIFTFILFTLNNIYAVDLKYEATKFIDKEFVNNQDGAIVRTFSNAYTDYGKYVDYKWVIPKYQKDVDNQGSRGTYRSNTFYFHGDFCLSNYTDKYVDGAIKRNGVEFAFYYDTYDGFISATSDELKYIRDVVNKYGSKKVYISKNDNVPDITIPWDGTKDEENGIFILRHKDIDSEKPGVYININDTYISKGVLNRLVEKYSPLGLIDETGRYLKVRMSVGLHTKAKNAGLLETGYDAIESMKTGWAVENLGYTNSYFNTPRTGTSVLNYYDNWLYIPLDKLNSRKVEIKYLVRDENGNWQTRKTDIKSFGKDENTFTKELLGTTEADGSNTDSYYIGGRIVKGATKEEAEKNVEFSENTWGWETDSFDIKASDDEEYYIVELYYDYRNIHEMHLKLDESTINSDWNKTHKKYTKDSMKLSARGNSFYYRGQKYVYVKTDNNGTESTNKTINVEGLDGAKSLKIGGNHYVKFYYEIQGTRKISVRHFVYNDEIGQYELVTDLTNSNVAIKDGEEGKYYLRPNGYSQRKYKAEYKNPTNDVPADYNQQYTVDYGDTVKLEKSWTIENGGILYEYKGYKKQNNSPPSILKTKEQVSILNKATSVTLNPAKVSTTYVDFYYTKTDVPAPGDDGEDPDDPDEPDLPTLDFIPKDESGNEIGIDSTGDLGDCKVVYVPSGEKLKAYLKAVTYRPYSLIYDAISIDEITGEIKYTLKKYDAYKFVNGAVKNDANSNYGYFNSTEKRGVFHTDDPNGVKVNPIESVINEALIQSVNTYKDLNPNSITTVSDGRKTNEADFGNDNIQRVNYDKYNGIRKPTGIAKYNVTSLVSDGANVFNVKSDEIYVNTKNDTMVNVFTPARVKDMIVKSEKVVNHSNQDTFVIQKNSEFEVTPVPDTTTTDYTNIADASKYIKHYWLVLDFDVKLVDNRTVFSKNSNDIVTLGNETILKAGNLVKIEKGGSFRAIATSDETTGDTINQFSNKLKVVAVTYNVTDEDFEKKIISTIVANSKSDYVDKDKIRKVDSNCEVKSSLQNHNKITDVSNLQVTQMYDDAHYFAEQTVESKNIGRVYDFKITDCLDVNLKNIFRVADNGNVNDLRGIKYFSGVRRLLVYGGDGVQLGANQSNRNNVFIDISNIDKTINEIASKTILPLGPYKHIDANYIQAPKLGYRFSFDLKTSGTYTKSNSNSSVRYIRITPSYYYISKDGKVFNDKIKLYYKNSSNKYINFEGSGYTIYFKPNDGYRYIYNPETSILKYMSTKLESLNIGGNASDTSFRLTENMMSYSDNNFVQAWYGEFKLPNSTIAIPEDGDLNNALTDGYIGVRFKIDCIDKKTPNSDENDPKVTTIVSYNQNDKSAGSLSTNTTQWDYEGYLGFSTSNIGSNLNGTLRLQLEKGFWDINTQDMYEKVKGTVVLYDIDNRAAEDFD